MTQSNSDFLAVSDSSLIAGITCFEVVSLTTSYLDGELNQADLKVFQSHISICKDCKNYIKQIEITIRLIRLSETDTLADPAETAELVDKFINRLH